jgi:hypothetical protein
MAITVRASCITETMEQSGQRKRLACSIFVLVGLLIMVIVGLASAPALIVTGSGTQTGWQISWNITTGPANVSAALGGPVVLFEQVTSGSCSLTGMFTGINDSGTSGQCQINATIIAMGYAPSLCYANFTLGATPPGHSSSLPVAWEAMAADKSELDLYYGVTSINGQNVSDFRVASPTHIYPTGYNTGLCTSFLFHGYSADTYVPAIEGDLNLTGTPGDYGAFVFYNATVEPIY